MKNYKRIFYDIEVSPAIVWGYPPYHDFRFLREIEPQKIMSITLYDEDAKELYTTTIENDYSQSTLRSQKWTDKKITKRIHRYLMKQADQHQLILIGHNSDKFDIKMLNARFIHWGLSALPDMQSDDTIKMARKGGKFASNSLDYLCQHFGLGGKIGSHASLWWQCIAGDNDTMDWAWVKMEKYNEQDVNLTLELFYKLLPYVQTTNVDKYNKEKSCNNCGSTNYMMKGVRPAAKRFNKRYVCNDCGSWFRSDKTYATYEEAIAAPKGV